MILISSLEQTKYVANHWGDLASNSTPRAHSKALRAPENTPKQDQWGPGPKFQFNDFHLLNFGTSNPMMFVVYP